MIRIMEEDIMTKEIKPMKDMKPLEIGRIIETSSSYNGHYVMRTASSTNFEVIDLSKPGEDGCWTEPEEMKVELLSEMDTLVIGISNGFGCSGVMYTKERRA